MALKRCMVMKIRWKRKRLSRSFAARWTDAMAKGIEKDNGRTVKNAGIFNSTCLEEIWLRQDWIFVDFSFCCLLSWSPSLPRRLVHVWVRQSTDSRYIPCQGFADIPRHYRVRPSGPFPSMRVGLTGSFVTGCQQKRMLCNWCHSERGVWQFCLGQNYTRNYGDHERRPSRRIDQCEVHRYWDQVWCQLPLALPHYPTYNRMKILVRPITNLIYEVLMQPKRRSDAK